MPLVTLVQQEVDMDIVKARSLDIQPCLLKEVRDFIEQHHYSHNINGVKVSYCFKVLHEGVLVGAVLFGSMSTTAWKKFSDNESKVLELRRLVLLDNLGRNSESRVIGFTLRWLKKNDPTIEIIVSYADPNHNHTGIIYKASNFQYLGLSSADIGYRDRDTGKVYHSRALRTKYKGDYKPFVKILREKHDKGLLEKIPLLGKHCYTYRLRGLV
jgi:hypothetical protein